MGEDFLLKELLYITNKNISNNKLEYILKEYGNIYKLFNVEEFDIENDNKLPKKFKKLIINIRKIIININYDKCFGEERKISNYNELINYLSFNMSFKEREVFKVLYFNSKNVLIKEEDLFLGTIDKTIIYVREIMKNILKYNAKSIIIVHNHPSGDFQPSKEDKEITEKIKEILKFFEVRLSDHIIISKKGHYSFLEKGLI